MAQLILPLAALLAGSFAAPAGLHVKREYVLIIGRRR
jgi:hypothetical protein